MKKVHLLLLILFVFSCKGTPDNKKTANEDGLSQQELTAEEDNTGSAAEFSDEASSDEMSADETSSGGPPANENTLTADGAADITEISGNPEIKTDDLQADARIEEKKSAVETVEDKKETPKPEDVKSSVEEKPSAPAAVQPPPVVAKEVPPPAAAPVKPPDVTKEGTSPATDVPPEQPAENKQDADQSEDNAPQTPPPRRQPWITPPPAVTAVKDDAPVPNRQGLVPPKEENVFSRIVRATVGQLIEIPFRGTNWSYLEDIVSRRGIVYGSRRVDSEGMIFTFRAEEAGTYILRFYRHDYIRDYILYDYVQAIVEDSPNKGGAGWFNPPNDRGKVTAEPRWPSALDEAAMLRGDGSSAKDKNGSSSAPQRASSSDRESAPAKAQGTAAPSQAASSSRESAAPQVVSPQSPPLVTAPETQTAAKTQTVEKQEKLSPDEMLKKAQDAFNGGKIPEAIALLDQYKEFYPDGGDELCWLYGQFYEANTPQRDILLSLDNYRRLVNEYPQSRRYNDARRRIAYLERFYINIQ